MSDSVLLWGDEFAPLTSCIGLLEAPLVVVSNALERWRRELYGSVTIQHLGGGLHRNIRALEPLTAGGQPRTLLVGTSNPQWTAVLDCSLSGGGVWPKVSYLSRRLNTSGVVVTSIRDMKESVAQVPRYGMRQFILDRRGPGFKLPPIDFSEPRWWDTLGVRGARDPSTLRRNSCLQPSQSHRTLHT